jgi:hypothetical protein
VVPRMNRPVKPSLYLTVGLGQRLEWQRSGDSQRRGPEQDQPYAEAGGAAENHAHSEQERRR